MTWLLESRIKASIEHAEATGFTPSAEQQIQFTAEREGRDVLTTAGNQAQVEVKGVLTKEVSFLARIFGGGNTTYGDISDAITRADADPSVSTINLNVDTPGGTFDGLFGLIATMQATKKPIIAHIDGMAASAGYAIVSQASKIIARDKSVRVGSIGVAASVRMPNDFSKEITSTDAPKKRPDVSTDEGVAMVREELDAMHDLFVDTIASGRGTSVAKVNDTYGQGACLLAESALKLGMIDAIGADAQMTTNAAPSGKPETKTMDLATLQAQHPATYAAAVKVGADAERDRVTAHATMGEASGDMATAMAAIKDGSAMTATLQATYLAAGMAKRDINARQEDEPKSDSAESAPTTSQADAVADIVAARMGVK